MNYNKILIVSIVVVVTVVILYYIQNIDTYTKKDKNKYSHIKTIHNLVYELHNHKNKNALLIRNNNKWKPINYSTYFDLIYSFAKALKIMEIENECIAILGFNAPGWFISHLGTMMSGNISVGIYPTNTSHGISYVLQESNARVLVVENNKQFKKISNIKNFTSLFPSLEYIISYAEPLDEFLLEGLNLKYIPFDQVIKIGTMSTEVIEDVNENKPATIIFTSGSTGNPKGVILTHKNIISNCISIANELNYLVKDNNQRIMSYLPLNHIASQMTDIYMAGLFGFEIYFPDSRVFKDTLIDNLLSIKPSLFVGIPRIWEKIKEGIENKISEDKIAQMGFYIAPSWLGLLKNIGLDKCKYAITTSAPLNSEVKSFFNKIGLQLYEIYGMSECSGPISISHPRNYKYNTVGKPLSHFSVEIINGNIHVSGDSLFIGYIGNTRNLPYFDTGDKGDLINGYLTITGREKDIIITSGGENITPSLIEDNIKNHIDIIEHVVVIGDNKKYLIALATLKCDISGRLLNDTISKLKNMNIHCNTLKEASFNTSLNTYLENKLNDINNKALSQTQTIKKIVILPKPLTIENDELTPTFKIKRNIIVQKYKQLIDKTYNN
jgi:long-chain-fatty-acid--CoA ligase ACSBG